VVASKISLAAGIINTLFLGISIYNLGGIYEYYNFFGEAIPVWLFLPLTILFIFAIFSYGFWFFIRIKKRNNQNVKHAKLISIALLLLPFFFYFSIVMTTTILLSRINF
jgi:hypothetical protein